MRSFTESDLSDADNIAPFENYTTPLNLINCSASFYFDIFILIKNNGTSVFSNGTMLYMSHNDYILTYLLN